MEELASTNRIGHIFSVSYLSLANRTVDSFMNSILSSTRAMVSELNLAPQDWFFVFRDIASALNEASIDLLGERADGIAVSSLECMNAIAPNRSILRTFSSDPKITKQKTI